MSGFRIFENTGGSLVLPAKENLLIDRGDGGHLVVNPPRDVWERSELTADELAQWSFLVAAAGRAMIDVLPQLVGGCVNYWEAGNWALNDDAPPKGPKTAEEHRRVHQHLMGRSPGASDPAWAWGEAPAFPRYVDRLQSTEKFQMLTGGECRAVVRRADEILTSNYGVSSRRRRPSLVIFDMAGTTVEDRGQVPEAFLAALREEGIESSLEQIAGIRGASKKEALRQFIPDGPDHDARTERAYDRFREGLRLTYEEQGVRSLGDAAEIFAWLRAAGVRIALNTGFDRVITELLLKRLDWERDAFDAVICGDDVEQGRPAPNLIHAAMQGTAIENPADVVNVGDTSLDMEAGVAASTGWNIGVLSGAHDAGRLSRAPGACIIPDISYLVALFPDV